MADLKTEIPLETLKRIERTEYSNSQDTKAAMEEVSAVLAQLDDNYEKSFCYALLSRLARWYLTFYKREAAGSQK